MDLSSLAALRAVAEPTRLRLLVLCARGELTVSELAQILGQSQPRVSRHLKLLCDAGLLDRFREGSWVFYRLSPGAAGSALGAPSGGRVPSDDPTMALDLQRLAAIKRQRADLAAAYFRENAAQWDQIRSLYVDEREVEAALLDIVAAAEPRDLLDIGTGTGRMLEIWRRASSTRSASTSRARCWRWRGSISNGPGSQTAWSGSATCTSCHCPMPSFDAVGDPSGAALRRPAGGGDRRGGAGVAAGRRAGAGRFRAACARIPARRACPSPSRLCRRRDRRMVPRRRARAGAAAPSAGRSADRHDLDGAAPAAAAELALRRPAPGARPRPSRGAAGMSRRIRLCRRSRGLLAADPVSDFDAGPPRVSFEFFPPKTPEMEARLWEAVKRLEPLAPRFVSVTYGAGGSTRERTHATVRRIRQETGARTGGAPDLRRRDPRRDRRGGAGLLGGRHPPYRRAARRSAGRAGERLRAACRAAIAYAADLVAGLKRVADFEISVAAYPETHPEARSAEARPRQSEGASSMPAPAARSRQFFFDVDVFLRFRDRARAAGIEVPIVPGILPVTNFAQLKEFRARAAPRSRPGWRRISTGSTTTPTPAGWSPPRLPPSSAAGSTPTACTNSISTH